MGSTDERGSSAGGAGVGGISRVTAAAALEEFRPTVTIEPLPWCCTSIEYACCTVCGAKGPVWHGNCKYAVMHVLTMACELTLCY